MAKQGRLLQQLENAERAEIAAPCGIPYPQPSRLIGSALVAAGSMTVMIGLLAMLIVCPLGVADTASYMMRLPIFLQIVISQVPDGTPLEFLMLPGELTIAAGYVLIKLGRRHLVATYGASALRSSGATLLYLRPFVADKSPLPLAVPLVFVDLFDMRYWTCGWLRLRGITRYEELIAYAFRHVGRAVTMGDPREHLPQLGASRVYCASAGASEAAWKTVVAEQIAGAKLILLHVGLSAAMHWEIEKVIAIADPQRVLLCVYPPGKQKTKSKLRPYSARRAEVNTAWSQFREACGAIFPHRLPETIGDARFVKFDANWTAEPVQATMRKVAWFMPQRPSWPRQDTMDGVIAWLLWVMIPEPFARRLARRTIHVATFIVASLVVVFAAFAAFGLLGR